MKTSTAREATGRRCNRPSRGFTLIEMLVVVAIIGVLVALLMPSLQTARETARSVSCSSKLRQIGAAMFVYYGDHGHKPNYMVNPIAPDNLYRVQWHYRLSSASNNGYPPFESGYLPHVRNWDPDGTRPEERRESWWWCPSYPYADVPGMNVRLTYGMNRAHGFERALRLDQVTTFAWFNNNDPYPPRTVQSMSAVFAFGCGRAGGSGAQLMRRTSPPGEAPDPDGNLNYVWHSRGSPFVFLDGHVSTRSLRFLQDSFYREFNRSSGNREADLFWWGIETF